MKTLQTIQTISKIAKIVSKVIAVFCIVGFCLCIVGIVSLALGAPTFKIGGVTLESILQTEAGMSAGSMYASMTTGAIACVGGCILAKFSAHYFEREWTDGTPFTLDGSKELLRLGVLSICIPIGMQILVQIAEAIFMKVLTNVEPQDLDTGGSVAVGVMLIIMALLCKYGAQLNENNGADKNESGKDGNETDGLL